MDLNERKVVQVLDTGVVPIPDAPIDYDQESIGQLRAAPNEISIEQPLGPSFRLDGHLVKWQKWQFHFRIDPRVGPVVSLVQYSDKSRPRSILYQGSLSELFVPYMDPSPAWFYRAYLDAGELGVGKLAAPLQPNADCPGNAVFFDAVFADDTGRPITHRRAACLFERYCGGIAWRHFESENGAHEVRRQTELVLRFVSAIGNYDYVFDWVFGQNGSIRIAVGSSGTEQVKAVQSRSISAESGAEDAAHGHFVTEHTVGINHDHFFCFRLDLDVDGQNNSLQIDRLRTKRLDEREPRKSIWVVESSTAAREQDAKMRINLEKPALWRVTNPNVRGPMGYPVSYQLKPKSNAVSLMVGDDVVQRRAGFTDFHLWVTPFDPGERFAAGDHPNQSLGGDGLPDGPMPIVRFRIKTLSCGTRWASSRRASGRLPDVAVTLE